MLVVVGFPKQAAVGIDVTHLAGKSVLVAKWYLYREGKYEDVTYKARRFVVDNILKIPAGDFNRAAVLGDPLQGEIKNILITLGGVSEVYPATKEVFVDMRNQLGLSPIEKKVEEKQETKKPETKKPETKKPETKKPETKKPETKKPETKKPETKKQETKKQETKKPETKKPETKKPETKKQETKKPQEKK